MVSFTVAKTIRLFYDGECFFLAQINDNIQLIKEMSPNAIEDFLPLVEVDTWKLKAFSKNVNKGQSELLEVHPIYFFSKKLNVRN